MLHEIITQSAAKAIETELYFLSRLADDAVTAIPRLAGDITYLDTQVFCRQWYRDERRIEAAHYGKPCDGGPDCSGPCFDFCDCVHCDGGWIGQCAPESHANYEEPLSYHYGSDGSVLDLDPPVAYFAHIASTANDPFGPECEW